MPGSQQCWLTELTPVLTQEDVPLQAEWKSVLCVFSQMRPPETPLQCTHLQKADVFHL